MSEAKLRSIAPSTPDERRRAGDTSARVKLKRWRRLLGWSTERLAHWLGCSPDAVQLWESGKRRVPAWPLEALFLAFDTERPTAAVEQREESLQRGREAA